MELSIHTVLQFPLWALGTAYYDQGNDPLKTQDTLAFWLELLEVNMNLGLALTGFARTELTLSNITSIFLHHLF